ncbi:MAG: MoaD/ThiS family protein [Spirochaetes bacterium]|nr:MAG: MoaD/ThiS family protein [Spirochaetota bacterium]
MHVTVKLFASLRTGRFEARTMELNPGTSVRTVVETLGIPLNEVTLILVDHRHRDLDFELSDGQTCALFPPVGGG